MAQFYITPMSELILSKFSLGVGDRFAHQAGAQLRACQLAAEKGVEVIPVWNKSNREHLIVGSKPGAVRQAADRAVLNQKWGRPYHVDADHINLKTVEPFLSPCDFFTIDVADWIGKPAADSAVDAFANRHRELTGAIDVPGIPEPLRIGEGEVKRIAGKYLAAVEQAGAIYRHIESSKGRGNFIPAVSMDETDDPQSPIELLVILAAIAGQGIPIQTIAPKFTGRFNKGVDYVGDPVGFGREFRDDVAVIGFAVDRYALPGNLKLSVHSGSDKFSIYAQIHQTLKETGAGVHVKTAGTTWLEELIGLAEAGGEGLALAKHVYADAHAHYDELCAPYAAVIDINPATLPSPAQVESWSSDEFAAALRHDPNSPRYHSGLRQLLHVGYKVAAKLGQRYLDLLVQCESDVARNVTGNLYDRHIRPIFIGR
jgi:hypothetical protein